MSEPDAVKRRVQARKEWRRRMAQAQYHKPDPMKAVQRACGYSTKAVGARIAARRK